jgi:hypothetical protein
MLSAIMLSVVMLNVAAPNLNNEDYQIRRKRQLQIRRFVVVNVDNIDDARSVDSSMSDVCDVNVAKFKVPESCD